MCTARNVMHTYAGSVESIFLLKTGAMIIKGTVKDKGFVREVGLGDIPEIKCVRLLFVEVYDFHR